MFYHIRFQTGEIKETIQEMKKGNIPCMDVKDIDEYNWVLEKLSQQGIIRNENIPLDKNARDRIKEVDFEFRAAFSSTEEDKIMYIDFYFEPFVEKDYDPILGD